VCAAGWRESDFLARNYSYFGEKPHLLFVIRALIQLLGGDFLFFASAAFACESDK
jgi:hypothetical protein